MRLEIGIFGSVATLALDLNIVISVRCLALIYDLTNFQHLVFTSELILWRINFIFSSVRL